MRSRTGLPGSGGDAGFTLVELIIAIVIIGVITVPLADVVLGYFRNTDETTARLLESHDVQITSAYWAQDVASVGMRMAPDASGFYALKSSVAIGTDSLAGLPACPVTGTPVVRLAWDDFNASGGKTIVQVAYFLDMDSPAVLHRLRCDGSVMASPVTLTHDLSTQPAVACSATTCTLTLSLKDPGNRSPDPYVVTLTGQRRQSS
jgi:prepilin-type N-terminal cleavage/methylation domain-containing protein